MLIQVALTIHDSVPSFQMISSIMPRLSLTFILLVFLFFVSAFVINHIDAVIDTTCNIHNNETDTECICTDAETFNAAGEKLNALVHACPKKWCDENLGKKDSSCCDTILTVHALDINGATFDKCKWAKICDDSEGKPSVNWDCSNLPKEGLDKSERCPTQIESSSCVKSQAHGHSSALSAFFIATVVAVAGM